MKKVHLATAAVGVALLLLPGCGLISSTDPAEEESLALRERLGRVPPADAAPSAGNTPDQHDQDVRAFYEARTFRPAWTGDDRRLERAAKLLDVLGRAGEEGLEPEDYGVQALQEKLAAARERKLGQAGPSPADLADLDASLTAAVMHYASDVSSGRVQPEQLDIAWHTRPRELDLVQILGEAAEQDRLPEALAELAPPQPDYRGLRDALALHTKIAADGGWSPVSSGGLKPGARGPAVADLRRRLAASGDLGAAATEGDRYDDAVAQAVLRFQSRHGLEPGGALDPETATALNVPVERRLEEIRLNMERWRWVPRKLGERYVIVNVPGYDLQVREGDKPVLAMRVVAGKAFTPTPVFSDRMTYLVLNPFWNVPESIARNEFLGELRKDPGYLERHHMRVFEGHGDEATELTASTMDWAQVDEKRMAQLAFRQEPGAHNSLGRMKFMLPNDFNVYLHDTPAGHLFRRAERDFSHGCIRLEKPMELALYVLGSGWNQERIEEALAPGQEKKLDLPESLPVHIVYFTAWQSQDGTVHFGDDVYRLDPPLSAALKKHDGGAVTAVRRESRDE